MSNSKNLIIILIIIIAGVAGFLASSAYYGKKDGKKYQSLLVFPESKSFSGFTLIDKNKNKITQKQLMGHWTLLFFGYTNCPDVCPTTLSELQKTYKILEKDQVKKQIDVLFVSVDSDRDTPDSLNEYIGFFNTKFNAATADDANILSITTQIGVAYNIAKHEKGDLNYVVDHTAAIFLVNPEGNLYGIFPSPHHADKIAADLITLVGN